MLTPESGHAGLSGSLRRLADTALGVAQTRLSLLIAELDTEKTRLMGQAAYGLMALLLGLFGIVFLALTITVWLWESHRLLGLGVSTLLFLGASCACALAARRYGQRSDKPFEATLAELAEDRRRLQQDESA